MESEVIDKMEKKQREIIRDTVADLKCLDLPSLLIIKSGAEMLKARDSMEKEQQRNEAEKEVV